MKDEALAQVRPMCTLYNVHWGVDCDIRRIVNIAKEVAQWLVLQTTNREVGGSSPTLGGDDPMSVVDALLY